MDEKITKMRAASMLLERGVRFKITDAPFLLRALRLNRITIKGLKAGTIAAYSLIIYHRQLDLHIAEKEYLYRHIKDIAKVIAIATLNSRYRIKFLSGAFAHLLLWRVSYPTLIEMFVTLASLDSAVDFSSITIWMNQQTMMLMNPKTGHLREGS